VSKKQPMNDPSSVAGRVAGQLTAHSCRISIYRIVVHANSAQTLDFRIAASW